MNSFWEKTYYLPWEKKDQSPESNNLGNGKLPRSGLPSICCMKLILIPRWNSGSILHCYKGENSTCLVSMCFRAFSVLLSEREPSNARICQVSLQSWPVGRRSFSRNAGINQSTLMQNLRQILFCSINFECTKSQSGLDATFFIQTNHAAQVPTGSNNHFLKYQ